MKNVLPLSQAELPETDLQGKLISKKINERMISMIRPMHRAGQFIKTKLCGLSGVMITILSKQLWLTIL